MSLLKAFRNCTLFMLDHFIFNAMLLLYYKKCRCNLLFSQHYLDSINVVAGVSFGNFKTIMHNHGIWQTFEICLIYGIYTLNKLKINISSFLFFNVHTSSSRSLIQPCWQIIDHCSQNLLSFSLTHYKHYYYYQA